MRFWQKFGRRRYEDAAHALYTSLVAQSREHAFYARGGVPDSLDGRFDMIALHTYLVIRQLSREDASREERELGQALFDLMFADMDRNLREIGVGDLGVGRKIREMVSAFYGRVEAYEQGLADCAPEGMPNAVLTEAVRRNIYRGAAPDDGQVRQMAEYIVAAATHLGTQDSAELLRGKVSFCAAPQFDGLAWVND